MKKRLAPRRSPKQGRSQATVDAILQAAAYILVRDGWEKMNTNRIAERAGVNIASLYQYFPSKESIAVELQRLHGERVQERVLAALRVTDSPTDLRSVLHVLVQAAVEEHRVEPALHRALTEELPRSARRSSGAREAMMAAVAEIQKPLLRRVPNGDLAQFIARVATHAVIHEAAAERPELLDNPLLADELVAMLGLYLSRPASRGGERAAKRPRESGSAFIARREKHRAVREGST
jgi:AcrR family transcriptional regulator